MRLFRYLVFILSFPLFALNNPILPNAKLQIATPQLGEGGLVSFLGELGPRNLRGAITYANQWSQCQRFKASGEFLTQDLRYSDLNRRWVSQYSLGGEYQYFFSSSIFRNIYLGGTYVHSYHKGHGAHRIAGSDAGQGRLGTSFSPWECAYISGELDYDFVNYHRMHSPRKIVNGWGGSTRFLQYLGQEFSLRGDFEFHRPYFFYEGAFQWSRQFSSFAFHSGIYMNYTQGKEGLPNALGGGIEISLSFGSKAEKCCRSEKGRSGRCDGKWMCDLSEWALVSAARVPVVLAIQDPIETTGCAPPTSTPIPDQSALGVMTYSFPTSPYFSSSQPLTYSATNLPAGGSIDPTTGVVSGPSLRVPPVTATITATSACGSTSQNMTIDFGF